MLMRRVFLWFCHAQRSSAFHVSCSEFDLLQIDVVREHLQVRLILNDLDVHLGQSADTP